MPTSESSGAAAGSQSGHRRRRRKRKDRAGLAPGSPPVGSGWAMAAVVGLAGYALWTMLGTNTTPPESSLQPLAQAPAAAVAPANLASAPARDQFSGDRAY